MYSVTVKSDFDAAHFLYGYDGKCKNIHGHRWEVVVTISSESLKDGMVVDFTDIKRELKALTDSFDHSLIYEKDSLKPATLAALIDEDFKLNEVAFRPTAENFAHYFFGELKKKGFNITKAAVYETPTNCAEYSEG